MANNSNAAQTPAEAVSSAVTIDPPDDGGKQAAANAEVKSVDLANYDALTKKQNDGISVPIKDPAGKPIGINILVAGPDSKVRKDAVKANTQAALDKQGLAETTPDDIEDATFKVLCAVTLGWSGVVIEGKALPYSADNVRVLYARFPWVKEQVEKVANARAAFLEGLQPALDKPSKT